jgi:hypothetical protein
MKAVRVRSISTLLRKLIEYPNRYVFRGQADAAWPLSSTVERSFSPNADTPSAEEYALGQYRSKFHVFGRDHALPSSKIAWLASMQHHGVPTRLVDVTSSPFVALYFAIESLAAKPRRRASFAVFAFDLKAINEVAANTARSTAGIESVDLATLSCFNLDSTVQKLLDSPLLRGDLALIFGAEPTEQNLRLERQCGSFLIPTDLSIPFESILNHKRYESACIEKLIVPASLFPACFALLRTINLSARSLYGDLDGLGRSIRMELQAYR